MHEDKCIKATYKSGSNQITAIIIDLMMIDMKLEAGVNLCANNWL